MILNIAHRGVSGYMPENTMAAFSKALSFGVDMIELDVQVSKDKIPVIFHDHRLKRTTNGKGKIHNYTLTQLKKLDAGSWFDKKFSMEKIPCLHEVLELIGNKCQINLELKHSDKVKPSAIVGAVLRGVRSFAFKDNLLLSSKSRAILNQLIGQGFNIATIPHLTRTKQVELALKIKAFSINPYFRIVNKAFVQNAHREGIKVFPWTVNQEKEMRQMIRLGVDGIMTNYPDKLFRILKDVNT